MTGRPLRLGVNIDHVATIRNARGGMHPDPMRAARMAQAAGADGITAHLREDRRHISDDDIRRLRHEIDVPLNLEMAATDEMLQALREELATRIEQTLVGIARAMGGDANVEYRFGYPILVNDPEMTEFVRGVAREVVGEARTVESQPLMASEDVGYFIERATGCYFNVGILNEAKGITVYNHNPGFDIDEDALPVGVEMLVRCVEKYLSV